MTTMYSHYDGALENTVVEDRQREAETLLFLDLETSLGEEPRDIPDSEKLYEETEPPNMSELDGMGTTLTDPALIARFNGVRADLEREIRGDMCTIEQAQRYLEHLEISLLMEQDS